MFIVRESAVNVKFLKSENITYVLNAAEGKNQDVLKLQR